MSDEPKIDPLKTGTKPPLITSEQLTAQVQQLTAQKNELLIARDQLQTRLARIQTSLQENEVLRQKISEMLTESFQTFQTEWSRKSEYFPDIRLALIQKAVSSRAAE